MLTEHIFSQTKKTPSEGRISAFVVGEQSFETMEINFSYDYYTTDQQLRLTLNGTQVSEVENEERVVQGIEMVFNADIHSGKHSIKDGKVCATYWKIWATNGQTRFQTFNADEGEIELVVDHESEYYEAIFTFRSIGPAGTVKEIKGGTFTVKGRDSFTL